MFGLFKKNPPIVTIRLSSLEGLSRSHVDRKVLLEGLLQVWRVATGDAPDSFDIYGPYGIAKGRTVGLRAFENKLRSKGHDAYSGYSAWNGSRAGFIVSFFASPPYSTKFVEILLWFASSEMPVNATEIVRQIAALVHIDYGYMSELQGNCDPFSESPIERGIFGTSIQIGANELSRWNKTIHLAAEGRIRDVYPINFLNSSQVAFLRRLGEFEVEAVAENLYVLRIDDDIQLETLRRRFRAAG